MRIFFRIRRLLSRFLARRRPKGVFYINGAETLPQPLSAEEEAAVIARLSYDESARDVLVEHNLRLVAYIAKRFESTGTGIEELISIGTLGLMKAIASFHPDRNIKLATYASRCIENEILMYVRKLSGRRGEVSIDEPLHVDWDGNELLLSDVLGSEADAVGRDLEESEEREAVRRLVGDLSERERQIIELRFGMCGEEELTQKEVADRLHISQSYISRLEKRIMADLKKALEGAL